MSHSLSCYKVDDFISNHPCAALTSPRRNYEDTWQCETPRVKTTQASIDVMGHNNMTIMSLTTTHAVPGGPCWHPLCGECYAVMKILRMVNITLKFEARSRPDIERQPGTADKLLNLWTVRSGRQAESHWGDIIKTSRGAVTNIWLP